MLLDFGRSHGTCSRTDKRGVIIEAKLLKGALAINHLVIQVWNDDHYHIEKRYPVPVCFNKCWITGQKKNSPNTNSRCEGSAKLSSSGSWGGETESLQTMCFSKYFGLEGPGLNYPKTRQHSALLNYIVRLYQLWVRYTASKSESWQLPFDCINRSVERSHPMPRLPSYSSLIFIQELDATTKPLTFIERTHDASANFIEFAALLLVVQLGSQGPCYMRRDGWRSSWDG